MTPVARDAMSDATRIPVARGLAALALAVGAAALADGSGTVEADRAVSHFNYVLGTQTFDPAYQFSDEPALIETARAILDMGSNVLKFALDRDLTEGRDPDLPPIGTVADLAREEPVARALLDMPFAYTLVWVYTFGGGWWHDGFDEVEAAAEYQEMRGLTEHLLRTYTGTGKRFYLGHWEGDWHLRNGYDTSTDESITDTAVRGMVDWLNTRQRAVEDALQETPHEDVWVYHYTEVNLVRIAMEGRRSVANDVLPHTSVDYVSYSAYDSQHDLLPALEYIESKLPPKPSIAGRRVFVGEFGTPALERSAEAQRELALDVARVALEWGCPFALYWEMYNNEVTADGEQRGWWMIDDQGVKQPVYRLYEEYLSWARGYVANQVEATGVPPEAEAFRRAALKYLADKHASPPPDAPRR